MMTIHLAKVVVEHLLVTTMKTQWKVEGRLLLIILNRPGKAIVVIDFMILPKWEVNRTK